MQDSYLLPLSHDKLQSLQSHIRLLVKIEIIVKKSCRFIIFLTVIMLAGDTLRGIGQT